MSDGTKIQWSDASWTPIRARRKDGQPNMAGGGWICQRVSAGCQNCYAATINKRLGTGFDYDAKGIAASDIYLDEKALTQPLHWRRPRKVFVCSMTDLFGEWVPDEMIDRVFAVMALSKSHTFQLLTKRPERMREYVSTARERIAAVIRDGKMTTNRLYAFDMAGSVEGLPGTVHGPWWPLPNVWLGVSVEDQERADERIPELLATPAAVRFVSAEPLLGPVSLPPYIPFVKGQGYRAARGVLAADRPAAKLDWVIAGGESGPGARPMDLEWARAVVRQCQAAGTAVFYKQGGASNRCAHHRKGGHFECFPDDLKVREFPNV